MNRHFTYKVLLAQFVKFTERSPAAFRDFKKVFSFPPEKWLQMKTGRSTLSDCEENINPTKTYAETGFQNLSHFSNAFKELYGYNPSSVKAANLYIIHGE